MQADFNIIKRGRGRVLLSSGYEFYKHDTFKSGVSIWSCKKRKKTKCTGSVTISNDERSIVHFKNHIDTCTADPAGQEIEMVLSNSFEVAAQGQISVPEAFEKGIIELKNKGIDLTLPGSARLPKYSQKKSSMYRRRNKAAGVTKICAKTPAEVEVPKQYQDFLFADYSSDGVRILAYCSNEAKFHFETAQHFFMDATFRSCPRPFIQMFCIHADLGTDNNSTNIVPLLYAFMSHKDINSYSILMEIIKSQLPKWQPVKVTVDFEEAVIQALFKILPNTTVKGCFFHFTRCLKRKARALGLNKSKLTNRIVGLCCALPLLPNDMINEGWTYILGEMPSNVKNMIKFQKYMSKQWLDKKRIWCVYAERHRTTNSIEGWHRKINKKVTKAEVNFLKILPILIDDATVNTVRNDEFTSSRKRKLTNIDNDILIQKIQMELITGDISVGHFLEKLR